MRFLSNIAELTALRAAYALRGYFGEKPYILLLSVLVGVVSGLAALALKQSAHLCEMLSGMIAPEYSIWIVPALPLGAILLCVVIIRLFMKDKPYEKSLAGVITATSNGTSDIPRVHSYLHIFTSGVTVGFGGSAGLEAPTALTGSAIGSNIAKLLKTGTETRTLLLACGGAAGISAVFDSPVAGALFACEILLPSFSIPALIPLLMASASAAVLSEALNSSHPFIEITTGWRSVNLPFYIILGVVAGLVSVYTIRVSSAMGAYFKKFNNIWLKALFGGAILYFTFLIFPALRGEGYKMISLFLGGRGDAGEQVLANSPLSIFGDYPWVFVIICVILVLLKVISASITIESGGDGGIFAPSMFVGAFTGYVVAKTFNLLAPVLNLQHQLSEVNFLAVGMGGVLAGVMHAPMTGMFLIAEMTGGYKLFVPLMIVVSLSSFISKRIAKYNVYKTAIVARGGAPEPNQTAVIMEQVPIRRLVETNFTPVRDTDSLRTLVATVMNSKRNLFPVLDESGKLIGIVTLDNVRRFIMDETMYDLVLVYDVMSSPGPMLNADDSLASAARMFESLNAWTLPVKDDGKYIGFVSKAGVFDKYREMLRMKKDLF